MIRLRMSTLTFVSLKSIDSSPACVKQANGLGLTSIMHLTTLPSLFTGALVAAIALSTTTQASLIPRATVRLSLQSNLHLSRHTDFPLPLMATLPNPQNDRFVSLCDQPNQRGLCQQITNFNNGTCMNLDATLSKKVASVTLGVGTNCNVFL